MQCSNAKNLKLGDQKKRIPNFTKVEKDYLIGIIKEKYPGLEDKKTNRTSMQEKNEIWKKLESEFNNSAAISCYRSSEQLKRLYENKKKDLRKKMSLFKRETYKTGGGPPPPDVDFDETDKVLLEVLNQKTVTGLTSNFDSDNIEGVEEMDIETEKYSVENDIIFEFDDNEDTYKRCPVLKPLNPKLKLNIGSSKTRTPKEISDELEHITSQTDIKCIGESVPKLIKEPKTINSDTPRRRCTKGIRTLTSSDIGEKYNALLDKRLLLIEKQIQQSVTAENFLRNEEKQKLKILKLQEDNLLLEKEERLLRSEQLKLDIKYKKTLLSSVN